MTVNIYTDGGSRGNPGPAAAAFVVKNTDGEVVYKSGVYLGESTNNKAEYMGLLNAWNYVVTAGITEVNFFLDSELVVKQITGIYKIKDSSLLVIASKIKELERGTSIKVSYTHVLRHNNKDADKLVNEVLDRNSR